ncbi:MAG: serine protein kinase RIO [Candidatus Hodarchaeales archaeon]|jgi:RIO kinase 1
MKPDDKRIWEKLPDNSDRWRKKRKGKEDFQTINAVIDGNTTKILSGLQSRGILDSISGTVASGKESGVFLANLGSKGKLLCQDLSIESPIVIKIFRTSTLNFRSIEKYITGDIRFQKYSKKTRNVVKLWVEKEYRNLSRSNLAGVNVPKPILVKNNVLLMELIGVNGIPCPLLKVSPNEATEIMMHAILDQIKILYQKAGLVHADLSPYNIIIRNSIPYLIDMSQSVTLSHPKAEEFLERDLNNILYYFYSRGVNTPDTESVYDSIVNNTTNTEKEMVP